MTNELKIKISADLEALQKGLMQAETAIDNFASGAEKSSAGVTSALDKIDSAAKNTERTFTLLEKAPFTFGVNGKKAADNVSQGMSQIDAAGKKAEKSIDNLAQSTAELSTSTGMSKAQIDAWDAAARRNSMERYGNDVVKTTKDVKSLAAAQSTLSNSSNSLGKEIKGTNTVAIEFSRIVQDAPYGVIGVGNNITQLTQSFANLRAQTGSTSQALKIAFSSLLSGTNLLVLGISAVTTAFTVYSMWARKNKKDTEDTKDALQEYITALRDYVQAQDAVSRARTKGAQDSAREISTLRALYDVATDTTVATNKRKEAVDSLQKQYPSYFGDLRDEVVLTGQAESAYRRLTQEILASGRARAAIKLQADAYEELAALELRRIGRGDKIATLEDKLGAIRQRLSKFETGQSAERTALLEEGIELEKHLNELRKQRTEDGTREIKLYQDINNLQKSIIANVKDGGSIVDLAGDTKKNNQRKTAAEKLSEALIKNEERVQLAIRDSRDKELEELRIHYENLYKMAGDNSEARIQIAAQEADEVAAMHKKYDAIEARAAEKGYRAIQARRRKLAEQGIKYVSELREEDRKKREKAEKELAKRIYEENLYYSQQLGNAVGNALEDALGRGENFFKALRDEFKRTLIRMAADAAAAQIGKAIMSGISSSSGGNGGGFWGFLGGLFRFGSNFFKGSGYSSGSFPTGNYGGGNFPATNPIRSGGFVPGIQSSAPTSDSNSVSVLRGTDIYMSNNRIIRMNDRFNGGQ